VKAIKSRIYWNLDVSDKAIIQTIQKWARANGWTATPALFTINKIANLVQISPTGPPIDDADFKSKLTTLCERNNLNIKWCNTVDEWTGDSDDYGSAWEDYDEYLGDNASAIPRSQMVFASSNSGEAKDDSGDDSAWKDWCAGLEVDPGAIPDREMVFASEEGKDDSSTRDSDSLFGASPMSELIHTSSICLRL